MVLPVARAGPTFHDVMATGKFHGTMAPTTPSGSRNVMSTPPATGTVAPRCLSTAPGIEVEHFGNHADLVAALA